MFGNRVSATTLTTRIADHAFPEINATNFREDVTLLSTARALFGPRGKKFQAYILDFNYNDYSQEGAKEYISAWLECNMFSDVVTFFNIRRTDNVDEVYEIIGDLATKTGFSENEAGSKFLTQFCNDKKVVIYNNNDARQSIVATMEISMHQWHALVSGLTACYATWAVERGQYTADEIRMIQSLVDPEMGVDQYMDAVEKIAANCFDFQAEAKRFYLNGFEKRAIEGKIDSLRGRVENLARQIADYQSTLRNLYDDKAGVDQLLSAALTGSSDGNNELMDYFLANKKLFVDSISDDNTLVYFVGGYVDNFDVEVFERCIENDSSVLYRRYDAVSPSNITKEDYLALMKAIFLDETIKMKMFSKWRIGTGGYIEAIAGEENPPMQLKDCLPNPHLTYYRCYGSFEPDLMKAASECDYVRAVDISSAENGNVNFNDVTVMEKFIRDVLTKSTKFLELPDGTAVTSTEAIEWLKSQDEQA